MWNGFYNTNTLGTSLKEFYLEALALSDKSYVNVLQGWSRVWSDMEPLHYINTYLGNTSHNVVVNRYQYNGCAEWADKLCEIGSNEGSYYLYIILSIEKLEILVEKWKLTKKEI